MRCRLVSVAMMLGALEGACTGPGPAGPVGYSVSIVGGNGQRGSIGGRLPIPLQVRVLDPVGRGAEGLAVRWEVIVGGGSAEPVDSVTDPTGTARAWLTLGPRIGPDSVIATAGGLASIRLAATAQFPGDFVTVAAGEFVMGNDTHQLDERPAHRVNLSRPFGLGRTEVTQREWWLVMGTRPSAFGDCGDDCPVEQVNWDDVQDFLARLNVLDPGQRYRLPTEAEWEYSARAGTTGDFGGTGVAQEMGWYYQNSGLTPHPAGRKAANAWGLVDLHGNVAEWVADWYASGYASSAATDPTGPASGDFRVLRGGSWLANTVDARSSARFGGVPATRYEVAGFRLARDP